MQPSLDGGVHTFDVFPRRARVKSAVVLIIAAPLLLLLGPGVLGLGTQSLTVTCRRSGSVRCSIREGFWMGLSRHERVADDVSGLSEKRFAFETPAGPAQLLTYETGVNETERRIVKKALTRFLASNDTDMSLEQAFINPFALFGAFFTAMWIAVLIGVVWWPLTFVFPALLEVDLHRRLLRVRPSIGQPAIVELPFSDIQTVDVTVNTGGVLGDFIERAQNAQPARTFDDEPRAPPLEHLRFVLHSQEPVVLRNDAQLTRAELNDVAAQVRQLISPK